MSAIELLSTDLTYEAAVALDEKVDRGQEQGHALAIQAYKGRIWLQLGYESWDAYCETKRAAFAPALGREERREVVGEMRDAGMSARAIGSALGVGRATVDRDLAGGPNEPPVERPPVTGRDGKAYTKNPAREASPPPARLDPFAPPAVEPLTPDEAEIVAANKAQREASAEATVEEREELRRQKVATDLLEGVIPGLALMKEAWSLKYYRPHLANRPITNAMLDDAEAALRHIRKVLTEEGVL